MKGETLGSLHSRAFDEMAERGGHAPYHARCATISLAKNARAVAPPYNAERTLHSRRGGNPGALVRFKFHWCPRRDSHSHCPRFEVGASANWLTRAFYRGCESAGCSSDCAGQSVPALPQDAATNALHTVSLSIANWYHTLFADESSVPLYSYAGNSSATSAFSSCSSFTVALTFSRLKSFRETPCTTSHFPAAVVAIGKLQMSPFSIA